MFKNHDSIKKFNEQVKPNDILKNDAVKRRNRLCCYKFPFYGRSDRLSELDKKDELNLMCPSFK